MFQLNNTIIIIIIIIIIIVHAPLYKCRLQRQISCIHNWLHKVLKNWSILNYSKEIMYSFASDIAVQTGIDTALHAIQQGNIEQAKLNKAGIKY